ncbi:mitochondrial inner membrane COX18 isoform X2 [Brachionus plicatilis]|uniref:Mitochondrial inner membrane COX18 isoform X2 n=1 Tax=Brachionus plicatilis TaxID=10195 RepID=A0A3M7SMT3_BRAPC|nr:mitochondrial inner membrane COX18 isoform X2 [Brachionus plicatilis]
MNRIIGKNILSCSYLKNRVLSNFPICAANIRFVSTSDSKIKNVVISSPQSDMMTGTESQKFSFITDSPIAHTCEELITSLHDILSLEWSSTIFLTAFLFRLSICFPIKVYQEHLMAKLANLQPKDSVFISPEMKRKLTRQTVLIRNHLYRKENCQPQKIPISSVLQMPFWIYLSSATRNLTFGKNGNSLQMEQLSNEGFMWLSSLATSDPYGILPGLYCAIGLTTLIYSSLNTMGKKGLGKSVGLFWISSNFLSLLELVILDSIVVRRMLKIPKTSIEPANIYAAKSDMNIMTRKLLKIQSLNIQMIFNPLINLTFVRFDSQYSFNLLKLVKNNNISTASVCLSVNRKHLN